MASTKRRTKTSIKERLFNEYFNFSFYTAVQLLERASPEKEKLGQTNNPGKEAIRFSVKPGFAFPPSDIAGLEEEMGDPELPARMTVAFMGLIGPAGVLPNWYNELAVDQNRKKDFGLTAFFDMFQHRLVTLFYLAWKRHQITATFQKGATDKLSSHLLSLCGLGTKGLAGRIGFAEESLSYYSGLLSRQVPSGESIRSAVEHFCGANAEIEQFFQRLIPLDDEDRTQLGSLNSKLGIDALCGSSIWECQTKFRLLVGPLGYDEFLRFIPSGDMHKPAFSLVRYMVGIEYEFEIRFLIKREEVPGCVLGGSPKDAPKLGWTTWLKRDDFYLEEDPGITFYH